MKPVLKIITITLFFVFSGCSTQRGAHGENLINQIEHDSAHSETVELDISHLLVEYQTVE